MIIEALQHFFTPAPKHIKELGYVREAIAIEARVKRCESFWQPHLQKCKELILSAAEKLPQGSNIMILGSGGLHDVPLEELLERGFNITCVDIVHLPQVVKAQRGVSFVEKDLTGMAQRVYHGEKTFTPFEWSPEYAPDLVISLNLLSQLAMKLVAYAELDETFGENIIVDHLSWLRKQQTNILLISDISREYYQGERLAETVASLPCLGLDAPDETWVWDIAPKGEADREISIRHNVGAWLF